MLTADLRRFPVGPDDHVPDFGCGGGRPAFQPSRRGDAVVTLHAGPAGLRRVDQMVAAIRAAGKAPAVASARTACGDTTVMPRPDGSFGRVIAGAVLGHIPADHRALGQTAGVLRPGGQVAVAVPAWLPERICWRLSEDHHNASGGHVRICTRAGLEAKLARAGLRVGAHHQAPGLHCPRWWLTCVVGVDRADLPAARVNHQMLLWDIIKQPTIILLAERPRIRCSARALSSTRRNHSYAASPRRCRSLSGHMPPHEVPGGM